MFCRTDGSILTKASKVDDNGMQGYFHHVLFLPFHTFNLFCSITSTIFLCSIIMKRKISPVLNSSIEDALKERGENKNGEICMIDYCTSWNVKFTWNFWQNLFLLVPLSWRLKWAFLIQICPLSTLVVVKHFLGFHLLQNHWANFNQILHKAFRDSSLYKWRSLPFPERR